MSTFSNFKEIVNKSLKLHAKFFPELSKSVLRTVLQVCVNFLENQKYSKEIYENAVLKLKATGANVPEHYNEIFAGVFLLINCYLRLPKGIVKADELKAVLMDLQFQDECVEDIVKVLTNHRDSLSVNLYEMKALQTRVKSFEWRINISLIGSEITKLNQPTIILYFIRDQFKTAVEINISQFHRLRYTIALLLKEMQSLEERQIMKH